MKSFILLLLCQLTLFAAGQPLKSPVDIDATSEYATHKRVHRALKPDPPICNSNQYFDKEEGRCLGVTGGGRVIYINSTNTCNIKALHAHCNNPSYYYICKNDKTILAQCTQGQHFDNRLQKCVDVDPDDLVSSTIQPNLETFKSIQLLECKEPGTFPVPGDCTLFYTCETNGHWMFRSMFKCPKGMAYDAKTKMCDISSSCKGTNLNIPFCASEITRDHRNVKKPTNIESVTHIPTETTISEMTSTKEVVDDVTLANTDSVTTSDVSTSTFSYNNFKSTEFAILFDETSSTEHTSNTEHTSDTAMFTYSPTSEEEFLPTDQTDQFTESTTLLVSTFETDSPTERLSTENIFTDAATSSTVDFTTSSDEETPTSETSMVTTEQISEQLSTEFVTTDLSTADDENFEVQTTESSTVESSSVESSTLETSTLESSTFESSTLRSSTLESSILESSTLGSSTVESSSVESSTLESSTLESSTVESSSVENSSVESSTVESSTLESSTFESSTLESSTVESLSVENSTLESSTVESSTLESSTVESSTLESSTLESSTLESSTSESSTSESSTLESSTLESSTLESSTLESSTVESSTFESDEQSDLSTTEKETVNVTEEAEHDDEVTEPTEVAQTSSESILFTQEPNNNDTNSEPVTLANDVSVTNVPTSTEIDPTSGEAESTDAATTESISEETNPELISLSNATEPSITTELPVSTEQTTVSASYSSLGLSTASSIANEDSNILSTTSSYDANEVSDNVNINATDKPIVQDNPLTSALPTTNNIIQSAINLNTENVSNEPTLLPVSHSETSTESNTEPSNKHSSVTDKKIATPRENDITGKESVPTMNITRPTGRVSTDVVLPFMAVIFRIVDMIERCLMYVLSTNQS